MTDATGTTLTIESSSSRNQAEVERSASEASKIPSLRQLILRDVRDAQAFIGQALKRVSSCTDLTISQDLKLVGGQVNLILINLRSGEYEDMP